MKQLFSILKSRMASGNPSVLAVILDADGSSPRKAGAWMLTDAEGLLAGTVGGGSAEYEALLTAKTLLNQPEPAVRQFILRKNDGNDIGMVCGGNITVLFLPVLSGDPRWTSLTDAALRLLEDQSSGILALSVSGEASLFDNGGRLLAGSAAVYHHCRTAEYRNGRVYLPVSNGERVFVYGGGHLSQALVPLLTSVGFRVTVAECRPEFLTKERFPDAEELILTDYGVRNPRLKMSEEDYAVVMTSGHTYDFDVENILLRGPFAYLGVIGSRKKTESVNARLLAAGIPKARLKDVHTPVGLSIGAVTPEEIAVSICAEMIMVRAERRGSLKKSCPMHE